MKSWLKPRVEEILMALGALIWIIGELIAVKKGEDTTTSYVRRGRKKWPTLVVPPVVVGTVWLYLHFNHGIL